MMAWLIAVTPAFGKRERVLVTAAGLSPDLDGLGLLVDLIAPAFGMETGYFLSYHHSLHTLCAALGCGTIVWVLANERKLLTSTLAVGAFHLHLLCDLVGSRGPDGYQWPIPYLSPFSDDTLVWSGQWALNAWPNLLIAAVLATLSFYAIRSKRTTPFELVTKRLNQTLTVWVCGKR